MTNRVYILNGLKWTLYSNLSALWNCRIFSRCCNLWLFTNGLY